MVKPLKINLDFNGDFRQVVLKLANTYQPQQLPKDSHVQNLEEYVELMSQAIAQDFAHQLQPLIAQKLSDKIEQQLP